MKTLKFIAIAGFVAIMSVSCQEKPPVEEGENSQASAELVSFGFYLEDKDGSYYSTPLGGYVLIDNVKSMLLLGFSLCSDGSPSISNSGNAIKSHSDHANDGLPPFYQQDVL